MSEIYLDRVREDLAAMRRALGMRLPFEQGHIWANLALALAGAIVVALTRWTSLSSVPTTRGSLGHWMYMGVVTIPPLLALGVMAVIAHRRRDSAPLLWRDSRQAWPVAAVAAFLYLGFMAWAVNRGASAGTITASTLFLAGLFLLAPALVDRSLRHTIGWATATMIAGLSAPLGTYESAGLLIGGWLIAGGLSSAAIMVWQLRSRSENVAH